MNDNRRQNNELTRYLLGELSEAEQTDLEQRYFNDSELFDELAAVRTDLIDEYVRGELPPDLRERFEKFLRGARSREQVTFAEALARAKAAREVEISRPPVGRSSFREFFTSYRTPILAAAATLLLVIGLWAAYTILVRERPQLQQAQTEPPSMPATPTEISSPKLSNPSPVASPTQTTPLESKAVFATFVLTSGLVRGSSDGQKLVISKDVTHLKLQLMTEGAHLKNYEAVIRTPEGVEIWSNKQLPETGGVVTISVPANVLKNGDYLVRLSGRTAENANASAGNYYFRLEKR